MKAIVEHLRKLGRGDIKPEEPAFGICYELRMKKWVPNYKAHFFNWPKFSGHLQYPVCHESMSAQDAFDSIPNLWCDDSYGDDRRELCLFLADQIEKEQA